MLAKYFFDTDLAGNAEPQNERKSQNGFASVIGGTLMDWCSKVNSTSYASERIGEAHAEFSSAGVEIYGVGNATQRAMGIQYRLEEAGMEPEWPFELYIDNTAAIAFCKNTVHNTRLKHIDTRQCWCRQIRDKNVVTPIYVNTKENIADLFTKILPKATFEYLRDQVFVFYQGSNGIKETK